MKPKSTDSIKPQIIHKLDDFEEDTDEEVSIPAPSFTNTFTNDTSKSNVEVEEEEESDNSIASLSMAERQKRAEDRMMRLKSLSSRLKTPNGIVEMENEPAYLRRQIKLSDLPHSSESQVSRFTLTETEDENGNKKTELKQNNSFLHDNVD